MLERNCRTGDKTIEFFDIKLGSHVSNHEANKGRKHERGVDKGET